MSYLHRSYLLGDVADESSLAAQDRLRAAYKTAYAFVLSLTPAQRKALVVLVQRQINALPPVKQEKAQVTASSLVKVDPRTVTGLGLAEAAGTLATIAQISSIVAGIGSLGIGVWSFVDKQKADKKQQKAAMVQSQLQEQALRQQINQTQQQIDKSAENPNKPSVAPTLVVGGGLAVAVALLAS